MVEKELLSKQYKIPNGIINLCVLYYWLMEEFDAELHGDYIIVTNRIAHKRVLQCLDDEDVDWESIFGSIVIDHKLYQNCIIEWIINVDTGDNPGISIGIVAVDDIINKQLLNKNCFIDHNYCNALNVYGLYISENISVLDTTVDNALVKQFKESELHLLVGKDNIIRMELNMMDETIKYWINDKTEGIAFKYIDLRYKYRFALAMYEDTVTVKIVDLNIKYY